MEIVPAIPAQAVALRRLHLLTWEAAYGGHASEPWYARGLAEHAARDWGEIVRLQHTRGGAILAAINSGQILGLCQYGRAEDCGLDGEDEVGQIQRLYVHPEQQGTGIGRALLAAATSRLLHSGMHTVTLWVLESDQRARAFYERLGWVPDGARKTHPPTDVRYRLALL